MDDLQPFDPDAFATGLFDVAEETEQANDLIEVHELPPETEEVETVDQTEQ